MLIGDREELVKIRFRYRYTFSDYCLEILPIGLAHDAIKLMLVHPLDTIMIKMSLPASPSEDQSQTALDSAHEVLKVDGWKGFYKGYPAALAHYAVNRLAFYCFFDLFKNVLIRDTRLYPEWKFRVVHGHAALLADFVSYPFDTVRVNMMADAGKENPKYIDVLDCAKKIVEEKGLKGLFKGFSIQLLQHTWRWYGHMYNYMQAP
jgi:hypothetical protein